MKRAMIAVVLLCLLPVLSGNTVLAFLGPKGKDVEEKKASVRKESEDLLKAMIAKKPELKQKIAKAVGYATFSSVNVNLLLLATSNGYGLAVDNKTKKETFMRVASIGGGVGAGIKDLKLLFIFNNRDAMTRFVDQGWQFGGQADATAKSGDKGLAMEERLEVTADTKKPGASVGRSEGLGEVTSLGAPVEIYQITSAGIAIQATVSGTKYWKDGALNK